MPKDKFGEAEPIGTSSPELGTWTVSGATSNEAPAPSDLNYASPSLGSSAPPPPPTIQYEPPPDGFRLPATTERNWYAVLSLIFGFVGPGLIGIGLGVAGLKAAKDGRATNRTLALWGIIVNIAALIFWGGVVLFVVNAPVDPGPEDSSLDSGDFSVEEAGYTEFGDLRVGDCISQPDLDADVTSGLVVVNCATPHWGQMYAIDDLPAGDFPGEDELNTVVNDACSSDAAIDNLVSDIPEDLFIWYYWPSESSWLDGDRSYDCLVYSENGPLDQSYVD